MVNAGQITIGAELDTQNLDSGVARAKQGLKEIGDSANSVEADTNSLGSAMGSLGKAVGIAATIGAGLFAGIAAKAPATAASMARIEVTTGKFIRETGEDIAPFVSEAATGLEKAQQFFATDPLMRARELEQDIIDPFGILHGEEGGLLSKLFEVFRNGKDNADKKIIENNNEAGLHD